MACANLLLLSALACGSLLLGTTAGRPISSTAPGGLLQSRSACGFGPQYSLLHVRGGSPEPMLSSPRQSCPHQRSVQSGGPAPAPRSCWAT